MIVGRYGDDLELAAKRLSLLDRIDDAWETGDDYAMASWSPLPWATTNAVGYAVIGNAQMEGTDAEGLLVHALAWQAYQACTSVGGRRSRRRSFHASRPCSGTARLILRTSPRTSSARYPRSRRRRRHRAALATGADPGRVGQWPWWHGRQQRDERRCVAGMGCAPARGPRDGGRDVGRVRRQTHPWSFAVVAGGAGDAPRRSRAP